MLSEETIEEMIEVNYAESSATSLSSAFKDWPDTILIGSPRSDCYEGWPSLTDKITEQENILSTGPLHY